MTLSNLTTFFYRDIFPNTKKIKYIPKTNYQKDMNAIIHKNIIIYGRIGHGKTETIRRIVQEAVKKYKTKNVNANYSEYGSLYYLRKYGLDDKLINILFADNMTLRKIDSNELTKFFEIRHHWKNQINRNYGLIITIMSVHRFHGLVKELRTNFDALICRNIPSEALGYDRKIIRGFIGNEGIRLLQQLEITRENDYNLKRYNIFTSKGIVGILDTPLATKNYLKEVSIPVSKGIYNLIKSNRR